MTDTLLGHWELDEFDRHRINDARDGEAVCYVGVNGHHDTLEEILKNSAMIVAAPLMHSVLQAASITLRNRDQDEREVKLLELIKYALATAEARL